MTPRLACSGSPETECELTVPKMCGEKEVLAQIKLSFQSINKSKMVCTRSMQLTVQGSGKRVQKTLDGQLLVVKNGERHTISSKCAELDMVMPQYLGVSRAVLEYVIFCHQDDSLWPMSEPATLKRRFDEIFEAMKYTKAVENLKNLKKKQITELGKLRILLDQYRTDKDRGEKAKLRSDELHEEIEDMRAQVEKLTIEMKEVQAEQQRLFATAKGFEGTIATLAMKRNDAKSRANYIKEQSSHMTHLEESDEELERMQAAFRERMDTYHEAIEDRKREHLEAQNTLEEARGRLNVKLTEQGRIQAEQKAYEADLEDREGLVRELASKHMIKGFDGELDDYTIQDFAARIDKMSREQNQVLERVKMEYRQQIGAAQDEYNSINAQKASLEQKRAYAQNQSQELGNKASVLQKKLLGLNTDTGKKTLVEQELQGKTSQLENAKKELERGKFEQKVQAEQDKLREKERKKESVTDELYQATRNADHRAKLSIMNQNMENRKKALDSL